jgi:hypothetical protein
MSTRRWGAIIGAIALPSIVFLQRPGALPLFDLFIWLFFGLLALVGAVYGASIVGLILDTTLGEAKLTSTLIVLACLSLIPLWLHVRQDRWAQAFNSRADSVPGEATGIRRGNADIVRFTLGRPNRIANYFPTDGIRPLKGDTLWVYYLPTAPDSVQVGRPAAYWEITGEYLAWLWLGLGPAIYFAFSFHDRYKTGSHTRTA